MNIHVCLISAQPMANLLPLLLEKPERAVFLVSPEMRPQARRLREILLPRGIRVEEREIPAYGFGPVADACRALVGRFPDADITLNVTGGTKVAALAAFQVFYFDDHRIIYLDTSADRLMELAPDEGEVLLAENLVKPRDYLAAYGLRMMNDGAPPAGHAARARHLKDIARIMTTDERLAGAWNAALEREWNPGAGYANIPVNRLGPMGDELGRVLESCGVAARGSGVINVHGDENRFFCQGGWLEEYVFHELESQGLKGVSPLMNVRVQWDEQGKKVPTNEFDLVFTRRNRLFMVSCKAANLERSGGGPGKQALYELDSLADRAGGLFGRAMLVAARPLSPYDRKRARSMGIEVCHGRDILKVGKWLRDKSA